ncbi:MAG TPA: arginine deiminase-related protein [Candidatus Saccharimonadales bacterium]|nr:arginine deiminase-related protein [Candidatus Saccharimonadales bacterium]
MADTQSARGILMVRPISFGFDQETARSNTFQHRLPIGKGRMREQACKEFDAAVQSLRNHGISITVFEDGPLPEKPDAVFPNNWLSMWPDGTVYLYPMATESRRVERSRAALNLLTNQWQITHVEDLSVHEKEGSFLESTGVMIFDHIHKIVYGCLSVRCDEALFRAHAIALGYKPFLFRAVNELGTPIYHTNVLMGVQTKTAVVCMESIRDSGERSTLEELLVNSGRTVITISYDQMNSFCGNILEVQNKSGERFVVMSQKAYDTFTREQREQLSKSGALLPISIPTIEIVGGGSARCMMAEIFLPEKQTI